MELKTRRDGDLGLRPCDKFLSNTPEEQISHIISELQELDREVISGDRERMAEEAIDVIISCITFLTIIGYAGDPLREKFREVTEKNEARGYYNTPIS